MGKAGIFVVPYSCSFVLKNINWETLPFSNQGSTLIYRFSHAWKQSSHFFSCTVKKRRKKLCTHNFSTEMMIILVDAWLSFAVPFHQSSFAWRKIHYIPSLSPVWIKTCHDGQHTWRTTLFTMKYVVCLQATPIHAISSCKRLHSQ